MDSSDIPTTDLPATVRKRTNPRAAISAAFALLAVIAVCGGTLYNKAREAHMLIRADNAISVTDSQGISANVDGRVEQILVKPGDQIKQGQLVAIIANPDLLAAYKKAQQDLLDAQKQDNATQAAILPPPIEGGFALGPPPDLSKIKPLPPVQQQQSSPAISDVASQNPAETAKFDLIQAALAKDRQQLAKANDASTIAQSELEEAQNAYQASLLPIDSLKSSVEFAKTKRDKFQGLYNDGIISRVEFQQKQGDLDNAQSSLDQATQNAATSEDNVKAKQTAVDSASKSIVDAQAAISKDQALLAKASQPSQIAKDSKPSLPPLKLPKNPFPVTLAHHRGRLGIPNFAPPPSSLAPVKVAFSADKHGVAESKVEKAQRILNEIQEKIKACRVLSNSDGAVTQINAQPGQPILANSVIVTLMKPASQRVIATFAHEPALRIRYGQQCDVEFTQFPHRIFAGQVARFIDSGSGTLPAKVEILIPERETILAFLPPGTPTAVQVHTG